MVKKKDKDYWDDFGKRMEEWGEDFGKRMETKFACQTHAPNFSIGGFLIGLLVLGWGVTWLGNELGWWIMPFPFWPIIIILIGLAILLSTIKNAFH